MVLPCEVKVLEERAQIASYRKQNTIEKEIQFSGNGLFSGLPIQMNLKPLPTGSGILFQRIDLIDKPIIPAKLDYIIGTPRCTILGKGKAVIQSVEHILSALSALNIDNLLIELSGPEIPVGDGSSLPFVNLLKSAKIQEQALELPCYFLEEPIYWSDNGVHIVAIPSKELMYSYLLSYPGHPMLNSQFYSFVMDEEDYIKEVAPCRTFSLYEEILPLIEKGIIKGGTLSNGVVINGQEVLNPDGLRFKDEMARHKMLDLIGDISLMGIRVVAHFIAVRSGHYANTELAKKILASVKGANN